MFIITLFLVILSVSYVLANDFTYAEKNFDFPATCKVCFVEKLIHGLVHTRDCVTVTASESEIKQKISFVINNYARDFDYLDIRCSGEFAKYSKKTRR